MISQDDAKYLLAGLGIFITFAIAWLPTLKIPDYSKFSILAILSLVGGLLTVIATNQLITGGSLIQNGAVVLTAAQVFYYTTFRYLGLERALFPQQALSTQVKEQAKLETPTVTNAQARDILDPSEPPSVEVKAQVVNSLPAVVPEEKLL
jgi:hypothetical protein